MKLQGYLRGSGRLGNIVCARVGRETIAKTHNPKKANPNTEKQVNERSRFKLITQLAASYAPVIAIPKEGNQSKRNRFVHRNYDILHAEGGQASIDLTQIQLTESSIGMPKIELIPTDYNIPAYIRISENISAIVDYVVYIIYEYTDIGNIKYSSSKIIHDKGDDGRFPWETNFMKTNGIVYAYGIRITDNKISIDFGKIRLENAVNLAKLIAYRNRISTKLAYTKTTGERSISAGNTADITSLYIGTDDGNYTYKPISFLYEPVFMNVSYINFVLIYGIDKNSLITWEKIKDGIQIQNGVFEWNDSAKRFAIYPYINAINSQIIIHVEGGTDIVIINN